jgi:outer membrane protein OmpA-like peptidoglycan-associated protein
MNKWLSVLMAFGVGLSLSTAEAGAQNSRSGGRILFANNSTIVPSQFHGHLQELANLLNSRPDLSVVLIGHTDRSPNSDRAYNELLSVNRAQAVKEFLRRKGVAESRMEILTAGFEQPIADNSLDSGRAQNRRVEIKIYETKSTPVVKSLMPPQPLPPLAR